MKNCTNQQIVVYDSKDRVWKYQRLQYKRQLFENDDCKIIGCNNCINCKKRNAYDWIARAKFEAKLWNRCYFITLTYNEENVPPELNNDDYQRFFKRLRRRGIEFKYMLTGEYGDKSYRPHYHLIMFTNYEFALKGIGRRSNTQYMDCDLIRNVWKKGFILVGLADINAMAYVAMYTTKKLYNKRMKFEKLKNKKSEFMRCSKVPAIGYEYVRRNREYFEKYYLEIPPSMLRESLFDKDFINKVKEERYNYVLDNKSFNKNLVEDKFRFDKIEKNLNNVLRYKRNNVI